MKGSAARSFALALQLLTRIPVRVAGEVTGDDLARSAALFPLVGAVQGLLAAAGAVLFLLGFPAEVTGALVVTLLVLTNGAFHLDGLADTFDGLAVRSSGDEERDRELRLAAMKDSATGAAGTVAVVLALLLKTLLAGSLLEAGDLRLAVALIFLLPVLAKWSLLPALLAGKAARRDGLGQAFIERSSPGILAAGTVTALLLVAAALPVAGVRASPAVAFAAAMAFGTLGLLSLIVTRRCRRAFGGITGDNLGAISELSEILYLAGASAWIRHST